MRNESIYAAVVVVAGRTVPVGMDIPSGTHETAEFSLAERCQVSCLVVASSKVSSSRLPSELILSARA
jgi:hypothetical protein